MSTLGELSTERQKKLVNKAQELGATHILPIEIGKKCDEIHDLFYKLIGDTWFVTADTLDYQFQESCNFSRTIPHCISLQPNNQGNNVDEWV